MSGQVTRGVPAQDAETAGARRRENQHHTSCVSRLPTLGWPRGGSDLRDRGHPRRSRGVAPAVPRRTRCGVSRRPPDAAARRGGRAREPDAVTPVTPGPPSSVTSGSRGVNDGDAGLRFARLLASPVGVLITIPALVVAVGVGILLVGRDATRTASDQMARRLLTSNATSVQSDVAFALDQADPVLEQLRALADPARPIDDALVRIHDLVVGRPGVAYASISFPDGTFRGAYLAHLDAEDGAAAGSAGGAGGTTRIEVQESKLAAGGTDVRRYTVAAGALAPLRRETTDYDPRQRGFYRLAVATGARAWTEPYTFFASHETGITCTEPVYEPAATAGRLRCCAVLTVDFDVGALSQYVARPALEQARSLVYTRDGTILAYPAADRLALPAGDQLLRDARPARPGARCAVRVRAADRAAAVRAGGERRRLPRLGRADRRQARRRRGAARLVRRDAGPDPHAARADPRARALERDRQRRARSRSRSGSRSCSRGTWCGCGARSRSRARRPRSAEARARELGSYRLVARLGAGGMGEVWRAEHRLLARSAAIKLIRPEALRDPRSVDEVRERFRREAQTLASMRSRHTIAIYDYGVTEDGVFYYVMELLDGLDLESLVVPLRPAARGARDPAARSRPARRSPRRTTPACSTATSSRPTCSCAAPPTRSTSSSCSTSASSRPSTSRAAPPRSPSRASTRRDRPRPRSSRSSARCSARPASWRPSRSSACRSTAAPISTRSAAARGGCSPAARCSRATRPTPRLLHRHIYDADPEPGARRCRAGARRRWRR